MANKIIQPDELLLPTPELARKLIGSYLCHESNGEITRVRLTEVEAYDGPQDRACHAFRGKTPRNAVIFGPPGHWYVYLCYGIHWLLNIVVGPENYPAAILVRGVEDIFGPGRVTKTLGINKQYNLQRAHPASALWLEWADQSPPKKEIIALPRVGVDYAGPVWAAKPYRYIWNRKEFKPPIVPKVKNL